MSVRTYDPKESEIFKSALCSAGCGNPYLTICKLCNLAYCFEHLKTKPHVCDTKEEFIVLTSDEVIELFMDVEIPVPSTLEKKACEACGETHPDDCLDR